MLSHRPTSISLLAVAALCASLAIACGGGSSKPTATPAASATKPAAATTSTTPADFSLTSSAFANNGSMPQKYTCDGDNVSPPLAITGVPGRTVTLALTVIDIDGPGGAFVHWVVWNIDPATTDVPEATVPDAAVQGRTGRGGPGYFGPCPPSGTHRYVFTLRALDVELAIDASASGAPEIETATQGHVLGTATLTGTFAR